MKQYKNYIFDLYGTLIDIWTDEEQFSLWQKMCDVYREYGIEYEPLELKRLYHVFCNDESERIRESYDYPEIRLETVFERLLKGREGDVPEISRKFRRYSTIHMRPYPQTVDVLQNLRSKGKKIYLLSNAQKYFTEMELEVTGFTSFFDDIYLSSNCGVRKPDRAFMGRLLAEHDIDIKETVMVGNDIITDCGSADLYGMDSVFLNTFGLTDPQTDELMKKHLHNTEKVTLIMDGNTAHLLDL